jgi:hypothetical protein
MRLHNWYALGWVVIVLEFIVWEAWALTNVTDDKQPFTWYVRRIVGTWTSPVWWLALGFILWMGVHFLLVHRV